ncbi:tenascin-N-like isoform X3 [Polypterus senegalus]|uniref:tenascin-N-like isoform X3 n=1 Tax=Polypterus senegalus TaxID=55291 RepID=UPI001963C0AF|nr:tenascin-N-like isoform X3 [Polypterus senegalus]
MVFQNRLLILLGVLYMQLSLIITESQSREGEHGLTFSHVYKIDLPKSSSCNVELDSLPAKDQGSEMVASPEGQLEDNNLVFRHNIRLQTPKCDCEGSDAFKSMLLRLSRLEEEVNSLKDQCSQGCCGGGKGGTASLCSNHGTFKRETCECDCDEGWEGEDCSTRSCPNDCTDNGRCEDGKCICYQGYAGVDCSELLCPGDCSDKGHCVDGVCQCFEGFMGDDCSQRRCPNDCSNNGKCNNGVCICDEGFTGHDCSKVLGPKSLRLVRATEESLLVDWEHVPGAEYYIIKYHPAGAEGSIQQIRVPRSQNSYLITGLMPGVKYIIQLYAVIKETSSQPSSLEASTVIYLIDQIKVISQTEDSIHVEWKNPPTEVDYFKLTVVMPDGQEKEIRVARGEGAKTSYIIKNLLPGTMYLIRVQSVHGDAEGKPSSVNGMTELDSPTNLVTQSVTEDTATLSWNKVLAPIDSYRISYSSADGQSQEISVGADKNTHKLTGLRPGVEYTIYIWAIKGNRKSKKASTKAVTDLDSPTNLLIKSVTEDAALLSWNKVLAPVDGYKISYSSADGQSQEISVGAEKNSHKLTGLRPGVEYTVYVWAVKGNQNSKKSSTKTTTDFDSPSNLLTKSVTEDTATLSWNKALAPVDGYRISFSSEDGQSQEISVGAEENSHTLTGLRPGLEYTVYVWAVKGNRNSKKISTKATTDLDSPTNLLTKSVTEDTATLSWNKVLAPVDGYRISYSSADGKSQEISVDNEKDSHKLTGLKPGVEYTVYIWAVKGNQNSKKSSTKATTDFDSPSNLLTKSVTEDTATLSWNKALAPVDGYRISFSSEDGQSQEISVGAEENSHTLTGLRPGLEYTVYVWAVKGNRNSKKISTKATTDLDSPTNLLTKSVTEDTAILSWNKVLAPVDGYRISYSSADGKSQEISVDTEKDSHKLTGLKPGVEYTVYIWAVKGNQNSKKSSTKATTDLDSPTNLLTKSVTEDTATLSWNKVLAPVDGYRISYSSADGQSQEITVGAEKNSHKLTGLRPGVEYRVYVWAVKGNQNSKKASTQATTDLDSPTNLLTKSVTEDTATLSWNKVRAPVDGYRISYSSPDGQSQEISVGNEKNSYKLTGLRPGVEYTVYLWAVKGRQSSKKTSTKSTTDLDSPTNLHTKSVTEDTATLSWNKVLAPVDGYRISYSSTDGQSQEISMGPEKNFHKLTGLRPGVEYTVYLWAVKGSQSSKKASTKSTTELDSPTNLHTKSVTEDTATLSWNKVLAPVDGYRISYSSADGQSQEISVGPERDSHKLTGLRPGVEYTLKIWAVKGRKTSKKASAKAMTDIDSPTNLVATSVTEDTVTLSWNKVLAPVDGYRISYNSADGQSQEISVGAEKNSHKLTGLRPGVEYTIYIWAVKGNRKSKKTSTKATTNIDAPTNLKVTDVKQSSGIVTWTPPSASIDGYILTYRRADGNGQETEKQLGPSNMKYTLEGLELGVRYIVRLVAFKGVQRSRVAETTFLTVGIPFPFPMDCTQIMKNGNRTSGIYTIYVNNDRSKPLVVYCDMTTDGGGWIVFQRRSSGKVDFLRRWKNYTQGFGDMNDEFWLGLEKIYELTNTPTQYELRVDLRAGSESVYAVYDSFKLAPSRQKYKISVGNYRGNAGDAMTYHQGRGFTTIDQDNDIALSNCAFSHRGAWWYKNCHLANLNGKYGDSTHSQGVNWEPWKGHEFSIPFVEMKIRAHVSSDPTVIGRKKRSLAMRGKRLN